MNTNEKTAANTPDEIIELGLVSTETKGTGELINEMFGHFGEIGISE